MRDKRSFIDTVVIIRNMFFSTEIIEGNLKAIMRLILALAAHFKPDSFDYHTFNNIKTPINVPATPGSRKTSRNNKSSSSSMQRAASLVSLASEAAASLAEASKNASKGGSSSSARSIRYR